MTLNQIEDYRELLGLDDVVSTDGLWPLIDHIEELREELKGYSTLLDQWAAANPDDEFIQAYVEEKQAQVERLLYDE